MTLCQCGCNQDVRPGNRFVNGHNFKGKHYLKGKHHSAETKKKMSEAAKGRKHTEETKKKISEGNKGKTYSEESKRRISEVQTGRNHSQFIDGSNFILNRQLQFKKQECVFGCLKRKRYELHHEPPIKDILTWEGRLVNLCTSCHIRIRTGSLKLPEDVGVKWTIEQTKELLEE